MDARRPATDDCRSPAAPPRAERATLVLFPGALGDFVCFLPTLAAIRARRPDAPLVALVQAALLPLAVRPGLASSGAALDGAGVARLFVRDAAPAPPLAELAIGDVYSWFASGDPAVHENLARLGGGAFVHARFAPAAGDGGHAAAHFLRSAGIGHAANGATVEVPRPRLPLRAAERAFAAEFWRRHGLLGRPVLAMHRGAGTAAKRWAAEGFGRVSSWWRARGGTVLEVAGPAEGTCVARATAAETRDTVVASDLGLGDLAALLARADLYVGNDSGVSHLAGAVGARGVVVFGPTAARRWRPLGGRLLCLVASAPCDGIGIALGHVSSERVIRALASLQRAPHLDKVDTPY